MTQTQPEWTKEKQAQIDEIRRNLTPEQRAALQQAYDDYDECTRVTERLYTRKKKTSETKTNESK